MVCLSGRKPFLALLIAVLFFLAALFLTFPIATVTEEADPDLLWPGSGRWAEEQLADLSLPQKIAQLLLVSVDESFENANDLAYGRLYDLIERYEVGGILLPFSRSSDQQYLLSELQQRARIPLVVMDRGAQRDRSLLSLGVDSPGLLALAATGDTDLSYTLGYTTARFLRSIGVSQVGVDLKEFADQIDGIAPGDLRAEIEASGYERLDGYIRGLRDGRVSTAINPAYKFELPEPQRFRIPFFDADSLELMDFRYFPDPRVQSLTTDALTASSESSRIPVSFAASFLREKHGFGGTLVSTLQRWVEDLKLSIPDASVAAVVGGVDQLLVTEDQLDEAFNAILRAVHEGRIELTRIDESVEKILRSKAWLGLPDPLEGTPEGSVVRETELQKRLVDDFVARKSVTVLGNTGNALPLRLPSPRLLYLHVGSETDETTPFYFEEQLRRSAGDGFRIASHVDYSTMAYDLTALLADTSAYDAVLVVDPTPVAKLGLWLDAEESAPVSLRSLPSGERPVITVSFGNPRLIETLPAADAHLLVYDDSPASQRAAAEALFGKVDISGSLPIDLSGRMRRGDGLTLEQMNPRLGFGEEVGMDGQKIREVDALMEKAIHERAFPGVAVAAGRGGVVTLLRGYGRFTYDDSPIVDSTSVYDIASLTKVVATTTAAMLLYERGLLDLDAPVVNYLPKFGVNGKEEATIRHLLSHSAGFPAFRPYHTMGLRSREAVLNAVLSEKALYRPGSRHVYSDLSMVTMAMVVEQITGQPFDTFVKNEIFVPLGMVNTGFRPVGKGSDPNIVPTERDRTFRKRLMQGEVHDELAYLLGGTSGNAGLFSTAEDLSRFAFMLLNGGKINGIQFLKPETIELFTSPVNRRGGTTRALGWDTKGNRERTSAGNLFGPASFGHTGYTGSSIWIDPEENLFVILLANRVYPSRNNDRHVPYRSAVADVVFGSITGPPEPLLPRPVND